MIPWSQVRILEGTNPNDPGQGEGERREAATACRTASRNQSLLASDLEQGSGQTRLTDDARQGPRPEFRMVRDRHGCSRAFGAPLHHDVAAFPPNFLEALRGQDPADLAAG
jgi:hypothetical protein